MSKLLNALGLANVGAPVKSGGKSLMQTLPLHQMTHMTSVSTVDPQVVCQSVPSNLFTNQGARYQATIQRGVVNRIKHLVIKIDITVTGAASVLVPATHWFKMIELKSNGGAVIKTWYNDMFMLNAIASKDTNMFPCLMEGLNLDSDQRTLLGQTNPIPVNMRKSFYLCLESGIWEHIKTLWSDARADLTLDFLPDESGIIASSVGGAGSIICNGMTMILEGEEMSDSLEGYFKEAARDLSQSVTVIDPTIIFENSYSLNVGQNLIDLNNPRGKISGLYVLIRPTATGVRNQNNGWYQCLNIGDESGAVMDILDASNKSILGGSGVPAKHIRHEKWIHNFNNSIAHAKPFYLISHGQHLRDAFSSGQMKGCRTYDGSQCFLQITATAAVNEVQTITCLNVDNVQGSYRFLFRGELSSPLAYNATPAQMAATVAAMKIMKRNNVTVVFSGVMEGVITATFTTPETNGLCGDLLHVMADSLLNGAGASDLPVTTIAVPGKDGIVPGAQYDIRIYSLTWKLTNWTHGVLSSQLL